MSDRGEKHQSKFHTQLLILLEFKINNFNRVVLLDKIMSSLLSLKYPFSIFALTYQAGSEYNYTEKGIFNRS